MRWRQMIVIDSNHCKVVQKALEGNHPTDERTFSSLAILSDRLECLKKLSSAFSDVSFSDAVKELTEQQSPVAAC